MKEYIHFYYDLVIDNIKEINDYYYFTYKGDEFYFIFFNEGINRLNEYIKISNNLQLHYLLSHQVIINNKGSYLTTIDDVSYILLKIRTVNDDVSIFELVDRQNKIVKNADKTYIPWNYLWMSKIDYLEKSIREIKVDKIIIYSVDYYLGLGENAISVYNYASNFNKSYPLTWSHRRIYYPNKTINYLNPINYLYDYDVRDLAEYLKSVFFQDNDMAYIELDTLMKIKKFNNFSANMLLARLLYPSYYYDLLEKYINDKVDSTEFLSIINQQENYFLFIKKAYHLLSRYALMVSIDYLK